VSYLRGLAITNKEWAAMLHTKTYLHSNQEMLKGYPTSPTDIFSQSGDCHSFPPAQ